MDTSLQSLGDIALSHSRPSLTDLGQKSAKYTVSSKDSSQLSPAQMKSIDKAAKDFESMFVSEMLKPVFDSLAVDPMFGGGHGEEVMRSFMVQEYGKQIAQNGQFGLTASVKNALLQAQEAATGKAAESQPAL
ncbi:MAG: rod-binding protein [Bdellovibrionales bacterium]